MERFSNSFGSKDKPEYNGDREYCVNPDGEYAQDNPHSTYPDDGDSDFSFGEDEEYQSGDSADDFPSGLGLDSDSEIGLKYASDPEWRHPEESGREGRHDSFHDPRWDDKLEYKTILDLTQDSDPQEYQEESKFNGNNGSRKSRRPEAERRAYEESYYEDRDEEYGGTPQNRPSSRRMYGPPTCGRGESRRRQHNGTMATQPNLTPGNRATDPTLAAAVKTPAPLPVTKSPIVLRS